jgi:hypothetical protein
MPECEIHEQELKLIPKDAYRSYIIDALLAAGFNLSKSITVKPNPTKRLTLYEQKG